MSDRPAHGSETKQGPGWWIASDNRWYPPELHPDYVKPGDSDAGGTVSYTHLTLPTNREV